MPMRAAPYRPVQEVLHGKIVDDPYRWLEDRGDQRQRNGFGNSHCVVMPISQAPGNSNCLELEFRTS